MPTLLHIDSSPMGETSISRRLSREFVQRWVCANPQGTLIRRDLAKMVIPVVDADWVGANYTPRESRTPEQDQVLALSTELTREVLEADEYVIGVPMHNWGPAASFKLWADQIVRFGETIALTASGMKGVLFSKRVTIFASAGRRYGRDAEDPAKDHLGPWLRTYFTNLGVPDIRIMFADGAAAVSRGKVDPGSFLAPHLQAIDALLGGAISR